MLPTPDDAGITLRHEERGGQVILDVVVPTTTVRTTAVGPCTGASRAQVVAQVFGYFGGACPIARFTLTSPVRRPNAAGDKVW